GEDALQRAAPAQRRPVPVVKHPAGAEDERILLVRLLGAAAKLDAPKLAPPAREALGEEERRAGMVQTGAGPVDAPFALQPLVGDAVKLRRHLAHLLPDL